MLEEVSRFRILGWPGVRHWLTTKTRFPYVAVGLV
jgi:hypothetical protein